MMVLVIGFVSKAQTPFSTPNLLTGGATKITQNKGAGQFDSGLIVTPRFTDTASANLSVVKLYPGMLIRVLDTLWMRNESATRWNKMGGSVGSAGSYVDGIYRTPGIDSIYFTISGTTYAIKDSTDEDACDVIVDVLADIPELEDYSGNALTVIVTDSLRGGVFTYYSTGLTADDGIVFSATGKGSGYWKRQTAEGESVNATWWGAIGDNTTDNTAALQAAIDYSVSDYFKIKKVYIPPGRYITGQVVIPPGAQVIGAGAVERLDRANTKLIAKLGANQDIFRFNGDIDVANGRDFWYGKIQGISFLGENDNTYGHGLCFRNSDSDAVAMQDISIIEDCIVRGFPSGGIEIPDGGLPVFMSNMKIFNNAGPGITVSTGGANRFHSINFNNISGDCNDGGLIRLYGLDAGGSVNITNLKSEYRVATAFSNQAFQPNAIVIDSCNNTPINIFGASHISSVLDSASNKRKKPGDFILLSGTASNTPNIIWNGVAVRVRTSDLQTDPDPQIVSGYDIPYTVRTGRWGDWNRASVGRTKSVADIVGTSGIWHRSDILEGGAIEINGGLPALSLYETDASANQKQWIQTASGGNFSLRRVNDDSTTEQVYTVIGSTDNFRMLKTQQMFNSDLEFIDDSHTSTEQVWGVNPSSGSLIFYTKDDNSANPVVGFSMRRNGNTPDGIELRQRLIFNSPLADGTPANLVIASKVADVRKSSYFKTNNTVRDTINFFDNGRVGQLLFIQVADSNTVFTDGASGLSGFLKLSGSQNYKPDSGEVLVFLRTVTAWQEVSRVAYTKSNIGLGNVQNVDQTDASNLTSGTVAEARLPSTALQGYTLQVIPSSFSPSDANTIYVGSQSAFAGTGTAGSNKIYIPKTGTIKKVKLFVNNNTLGSSETSSIYIRLNNTTDYLITSSFVNDASFTEATNTSLSIPVTGDFTDYIEIKWVTPTWTTNPTSVRISAIIYIE